MGVIIRLLTVLVLWVCFVTPVYAGTKTYTPSDDVYISGTSGSTTRNFATFPSLRLNGDLNKYYVMLVRFPIEKLPLGQSVSSVKLRLYYREKIGGEPTLVKGAFTATSISSQWAEETVTWNSRPGRGQTALSGNEYYVLDSDPGYQTWDITPLAKSWFTNPETNFGMYIETFVRGWSCGFDAKEGQYAPELVVEYKNTFIKVIQPVINVIPGLVLSTPTLIPTSAPSPTSIVEPTTMPTLTTTPTRSPTRSPTLTISPSSTSRPGQSPHPTVDPDIDSTSPPEITHADLPGPQSRTSIDWRVIGVLGALVLICSIGSISIIRKVYKGGMYAKRPVAKKQIRK